MLERLLDPVARAIANAPIDDAPEGEDERTRFAKSKGWFKQRSGQGVPQKKVLADFGLCPDTPISN